MRKNALAAGLCAMCLCGAIVRGEETRVFDIPRLDGIVIDGNASHWGEGGMRVDLLTNVRGELKNPQDFDAAFRLGWNDQGLLVLLTVHDNAWSEDGEEDFLYRQDSVELYLADKRGGDNMVQVWVSPGMDPRHPAPRTHIMDYRKDDSLKKIKPSVQAVRTKISDNDYVMEVLLPWAMVGVKPGIDAEAAFQLYVNDFHGKDSLFNAIWYPGTGTFRDTTKMYPIRLTEKGSPPVLAVGLGGYDGVRHSRIIVAGAPSLAGKTIVMESNGSILAGRTMDANTLRPTASVLMPFPAPGQEFGKITISMDGNVIATVSMPPAAPFRDRLMVGEGAVGFVFHPNCFTGKDFPAGDFEQPMEMEQVIGPYQTKVRFYDANFNEVTSAEQLGRYGAVVEITAASGRKLHRFCTLYRYDGSARPWRNGPAAARELLCSMGVDAKAAERHSASAAGLIWDMARGGECEDLAKILGGIDQAQADSGEVRSYNDVWARDRQWWVTLKRKTIYGTEKLFPKPFVCPGPIEGTPATVLHDGTPEEAGMKDGAVDKIDAACKSWAADSNEAFAVCIVRDGAVFFHKAYGRRDGKDMTVDTPSNMASITKLLSGTLMMMLVDQARVRLDDAVEKYLPAMSGIAVKTPLTIRRLYNHTSGLWDHWGEDMNDLEEHVADVYADLRIGEASNYNGTGFALGGKLIETVTGEAIPQFYRKHLLGPLGCEHTDAMFTSYGTMSTPMDIARIGQMLLNKGAYGKWRFMRPETFEQMLPRDVNLVAGPPGFYGVGCHPTPVAGLGPGTFGHGAASSAIFRIDPDNQLVIVLCRNGPGALMPSHDAHLKQFFQAVVDGMNDRAATAPSGK